MNGFFLIDKPAGITSHDVVATVRLRLKSHPTSPLGLPTSPVGLRGTGHGADNAKLMTRVGHAGTLDPLATGLLIVGVGTATKQLGMLLKLPKTYEAELTLGATSTTDDAEGNIRKGSGQEAGDRWRPTREDVERALRKLTDEIEQVPPAYSAVKVRGVPAYRRARRGETVALSPRRVTVHMAKLLSFAYPHARIRWTVSSGTYIRSLARDLGDALGTGAYLSALRRTAIGPFAVQEAQALDTVASATLSATDEFFARLSAP